MPGLPFESRCSVAVANGLAAFTKTVFVVVFLSSAFFPRALLSEPAHSIADYNPMSFIAEGIRERVRLGVLDVEARLVALLPRDLLGLVRRQRFEPRQRFVRGFPITDLADHNHVRPFAQSAASPPRRATAG